MVDFKRGGKNSHMRTTEKKPCEVCGELADHYSDGTVSKHKQYLYKRVRGVMKKTSSWAYCEHKKWRS